MNCYTCSKPIKRAPSACLSKKIFCNHECYSKHKKTLWTKNNPRYSGGEKEYECIECGKKFTRRGHGKNINGKNKYCSIKCAAINRGKKNRRENHWNFKGEGGRITRPIRGLAKYEEWRMKVFSRDNFKCTKCDSDKSIQAHHIKGLSGMVTQYIKYFGKLNVYDDTFYDVNNGQTLCIECHKDIHKL